MKNLCRSILLLSFGFLALGRALPHHREIQTSPAPVYHTQWVDHGDNWSPESDRHAFDAVTVSHEYDSTHRLGIDDFSPPQGSPDTPPSATAFVDNDGNGREKWLHEAGSSSAPPPPPPGLEPLSTRGGDPEALTHALESDDPASETSKLLPIGPGNEDHRSGLAARDVDGGGSGGRGAALGGAGSSKSGASGRPRPLKAIATSFALARSNRAAVWPVNKYQADDIGPGVDFGLGCGAPFCFSGASPTMTNPFRYPVWVFAKVCSLTGNIGVHASDQPNGPVAHVHGLVPKLVATSLSSASSIHGSNHKTLHTAPAETRGEDHERSGQENAHGPVSNLGHEHSHDTHTFTSDRDRTPSPEHESSTHMAKDDHELQMPKNASIPDLASMLSPHDTNISEKLGGYVPVGVPPASSSASHGQLIPFLSIFRYAMLPMKALGRPVGSNAIVPHLDASGSDRGCGDVNENGGITLMDGKNAHESLGLGSALIRMWERMAGYMALQRE